MKKTNLFFLLLAFVLFPSLKAEASSLYYNQPVEKISEIRIGFEKSSVSPKAIEGVISFDPESFEFLKASVKDSAIKNWTTEPYLMEEGKIAFSGVFESEFEGDSIFSIFFNKINSQNLFLAMDSGVVLLEGDILENLDGINSKDSSLFNISSSTHPDSNTWYSEGVVNFEWTLPSDAQKVKLLVDENENSYPSVDYDELIFQKQVELTDGIWYFHMRYFGDNGWSAIESKKVMIDTTKPKNFQESISGRMMQLSATDELSGIGRYEITIPELDFKGSTESNSFSLSEIKKGEYKMRLSAYDLAGNYLDKEILVKVEGLDAPFLLGVFKSEGKFFVLGSANNPDGKVYVTISGNDFSFSEMVSVSADGKFVCSLDKLKPGLYNLYLTSVSDEGLSERVKKIILITEEELPFNSIEKVLLNYVLIILLLILMYACSSKKKIKKAKRGRKPKKNKK